MGAVRAGAREFGLGLLCHLVLLFGRWRAVAVCEYRASHPVATAAAKTGCTVWRQAGYKPVSGKVSDIQSVKEAQAARDGLPVARMSALAC